MRSSHLFKICEGVIDGPFALSRISLPSGRCNYVPEGMKPVTYLKIRTRIDILLPSHLL